MGTTSPEKKGASGGFSFVPRVRSPKAVSFFFPLEEEGSLPVGKEGTTTTVDGSEIRLYNQLRLVVEIPLFYRVWDTSKRWLVLGFLNHQQ